MQVWGTTKKERTDLMRIGRRRSQATDCMLGSETDRTRTGPGRLISIIVKDRKRGGEYEEREKTKEQCKDEGTETKETGDARCRCRPRVEDALCYPASARVTIALRRGDVRPIIRCRFGAHFQEQKAPFITGVNPVTVSMAAGPYISSLSDVCPAMLQIPRRCASPTELPPALGSSIHTISEYPGRIPSSYRNRRALTTIPAALHNRTPPSKMSQPPPGNDAEKNIEIWKIKKLIKRLEMARGNGTSMISLIIPPKDQVSRAAKMLAEEYGTASNIKSRVNRLSVLSAITSTQQRLKLYSKVPPNGLVVYCGEIITSEGKERKLNIDFEPFKPINTSLYLCDNKFHTEALSELLESDSKFGFIVMDGNGALFGTLSGNTREVVHKFAVDLPKKHGRGGQSALRFARLREEKRHNYVRKVAELAVQNFITADKVNVSGLILAGSADFKSELAQSDMFDQRLQAKIIKVVDVSYGGENGFNQAIELSAETLSNVKFIQEKKLINRYFDEISQDTGRVCYGIDDTLKALELGACETLIVFENLDVTRWTLKSSTGEEVILHTNKLQEQDRSKFMDKESGQEMEVVEQVAFLEWLAEKYKDFGATLEFVSDRSSEGNQFVKGFGGIGALLRYKVNFEQLAEIDDEDEQGLRAPREDHQEEMEKKEIRKITKKLYDTPEETTNSVLNFVAEMETPAFDDAHNVRANMNSHHVVRRVGGRGDRKSDAVGDASLHSGVVANKHCLSSAITIPPGVPVEIFAYG
ncbi:LOW QUALITY PROTEIN: hypothetical protein Dda_0907 [Drechslerella dactyloides]|uniref:eRF1/Pelota-like N-terminal domain-containing protein n=1 Tax=Drechslerella dactyloides TaxID=74499 RepID=A0AAD6J630_DREDA|nr:LOW QUALITY PROTEIN: hypothetical protein Dda_0907 [Drechslerella dactyloides]